MSRRPKDNGAACRVVRVMASGRTRVQCERCGRYYDRATKTIGVRCQCPAQRWHSPPSGYVIGIDLSRGL